MSCARKLRAERYGGGEGNGLTCGESVCKQWALAQDGLV